MVLLETVTDSRKQDGRIASWMIHLRVADLLMDRIPGLDETDFVMGIFGGLFHEEYLYRPAYPV